MASKTAFLIDDDKTFLEIEAKILKKIGFKTTSSSRISEALEKILECKPDYVLTDLVQPEISGLELCKQIKSNPDLKDTKVIIVSSKVYEYDKKQAFSVGADGYITKPLTEEKLNETIQSLKSKMTFWGIHGTLPVPGEDTNKYGGNTSCVSLEFSQGRNFIFDAGSGIKGLSDYLLKKYAGKQIKANLFITHPHWDHINAFPFFVPLYLQGNEIDVYGPQQMDKSMLQIMSDQMDGVYFPVTIKQFAAHVGYHDLKEGSYEIEGVKVDTLLLTHPGNCLGYKITYDNTTISYITDNELYFPDSPSYNASFYKNLVEFVSGSDYFIHDTTYFDEEYKSKVDWGHSCVSQVAKLAHEAEVKNYYIFHHDPDHRDDAVERKYEESSKKLKEYQSKTLCHIAKEKDIIYF